MLNYKTDLVTLVCEYRILLGDNPNMLIWFHLLDGAVEYRVTSSEVHGNTVCTVAFNHTGSTLASMAQDATAKLWDCATRKFLFRGNPTPTQPLTIDPNSHPH
jgi:hypothetical protein